MESERSDDQTIRRGVNIAKMKTSTKKMIFCYVETIVWVKSTSRYISDWSSGHHESVLLTETGEVLDPALEKEFTKTLNRQLHSIFIIVTDHNLSENKDVADETQYRIKGLWPKCNQILHLEPTAENWVIVMKHYDDALLIMDADDLSESVKFFNDGHVRVYIEDDVGIH